MKHAVLLFWLAILPAAFAQPPASKKTTPGKSQLKAASAKKTSAAKPKPSPAPRLSEKEQFEKASAHELAVDRVAAIEGFLTAFPQSENRAAAVDLLTSSRLLIAEEKLLSGDVAGAGALFKLVVDQMPRPVPNDLFTESISKIPSSLYFRGQRAPALELASIIESRVESNAAQLLEIANFHLSTENGSEAMRVAAKAAAIDPTSAAVRRTIALAHRINFDLELSADSYAKSLELEPGSIVSKRGLAEMKRALGKSDEAVALYGELVAKNESDLQSRTGLILSLFDAGKQSEAEGEMARSLAQSPGNVVLLAGAAYWYAAKGMGSKAVEFAEKAIAREPRYIWSHIALARGLMIQNKPVEAEQVLVKARAYGNFPTLEYELASTRMAAGFFREAVEDLEKQFTVTNNGNIRTSLGGRVAREEKGLAELVAFERKASIFAPAAADTTESADTLRALLILDQRLQAAQPDESEVIAAADAFAAGSDKMKLHRQVYAASMLLQKHIAVGKVLELAKAAIGNTDAALEVPNPRAAVMATELYEARAAAFRRNEFVLVPDVPAQTLSAILRGRIEEIAGWALYQQNNFPEAIVRLRRSISVLPGKSAWWRSSMWRLGAALAADGKDAEALTSYIESYKTDKPDYAKYVVVEALYKKLNGNIDGLEAMIGSGRAAVSPAIQEIKPSPAPVQSADTATANVPTDTSSVTMAPTAPVPEPSADRPQTPSSKSQENPKVEKPATAKPAAIGNEIPLRSEPAVKDKPSTQVESSLVEVKEDPKRDAEIKVPVAKTEETGRDTKRAGSTTRQTDQPAEKTTSKKGQPAQKSLFEPIIITIPKPHAVKAVNDAGKGETKEASEPNKAADSEKRSGETSETSGAERQRVIEGSDILLDKGPSCVVGVSQENVSLINNGGSVGILVSVDAAADIKSLKAVSSSPKDIELTLQPEIGGVSDRRFYVIKSISKSLGVYQVTFMTDCGKKDLIVTVR